jgi:Histidine kinase-, DNA gyrase B-, and HSP90-like ATPase
MPLNNTLFADAFPRKRFFVEMFTRDIALEDCVLDLVDNSIDSLIRSRQIDLQDEIVTNKRLSRPAHIEVTISPKAITVADDCGGIPTEKARHEVFNFGHSTDGALDLTERGIGAYGIGLKRAIFKMGSSFRVDSTQNGRGFRVEQDLNDWLDHDDSLDDWRFPLVELDSSKLKCPRHGTLIQVTELRENIRDLARNDEFLDRVKRAISRAYAFFLTRYVDIKVNNESIEPLDVPIGTATDYKPANETYKDDGVRVRLRAGLAPRGPRGEWQMERAGWYVLCNGRVVVTADKTSLTGWGAGILPQFHSSKGRGFVGLALFVSDNPLKLPWTTTKRGLNQESPVYLRARTRMQSVARPVYSYLESLYPTGNDATNDEREAAKKLGQASAKEFFEEKESEFKPPRVRTESEFVTVQFKVSRRTLDAIRRHLGKPNLSAVEIGKHALDYLVENEDVQ